MATQDASAGGARNECFATIALVPVGRTGRARSRGSTRPSRPAPADPRFPLVAGPAKRSSLPLLQLADSRQHCQGGVDAGWRLQARCLRAPVAAQRLAVQAPGVLGRLKRSLRRPGRRLVRGFLAQAGATLARWVSAVPGRVGVTVWRTEERHGEVRCIRDARARRGRSSRSSVVLVRSMTAVSLAPTSG